MLTLPLLHRHHPAHQGGVTREGADEGILARSRRSGELKLFGLLLIKQLGRKENVRSLGQKLLLKPISPESDGGRGHGVSLARFGENQVVRHEVGVHEDQFHLLAGLHFKGLHIELDLLDDGVNANGEKLGSFALDSAWLCLHLLFLLKLLWTGCRIGRSPPVLNRLGAHDDMGIG